MEPEERNVVKVQVDSGETITLSPSIIRKYLVAGSGNVTDQEVQMFMALCKFQRLNPFIREAYLIKYSGNLPATIVTGKETFLKRAATIPECRGFKAGVICQCKDTKEILNTDGYCPPDCVLLGGWAEVFKSNWDFPVRVEIGFNEYVGKKSDGSTNRMWTEKPATMIRKVALVQALREAFPSAYGGMYSPEEINTIQEPLPTTTVHTTEEQPKQEPKPRKKKETEPAQEPEIVPDDFGDSNVDMAPGPCPAGGPKAGEIPMAEYCNVLCRQRNGCPVWPTE